MSLLKNFWFYTILFLTAVLAVLAVAIWNSSDSSANKIPTSITADNPEAIEPTELPSQKPVPSNFPAPAKKLHQVMNDADFKPGTDTSLEQKTEALDQQLAAIAEQLKAQGINVPERETQKGTSGSDSQSKTTTAARLQAIQEYMEKKEK